MVTHQPTILNAAFGWPDAVATRVSFTGTAARTSAALTDDKIYILVASEDCFVKYGNSSIDATSTSFHWPLFRGIPMVIRTPYQNGTGTYYLSAIQRDTAGVLNILPMTDY